jgi:hypothetical protein
MYQLVSNQLGRSNATCPVPYFNSLGTGMGMDMDKGESIFGLNTNKVKIKSDQELALYYTSVLLTRTVSVTWAVQCTASCCMLSFSIYMYVPFFGPVTCFTWNFVTYSKVQQEYPALSYLLHVTVPPRY